MKPTSPHEGHRPGYPFDGEVLLLMSGEEVYRRLELDARAPKSAYSVRTFEVVAKHPSPLARLATARFCPYCEPLKTLSEDQDQLVRLSALMNPGRLNEGFSETWRKFFSNPDSAEAHALLRNPRLPYEVFSDLVLRESEFSALTDDQWHALCSDCLFGNPKFYPDFGWDHKLFQLVTIAPVTDAWRRTFYNFLLLSRVRRPSTVSFVPVIERWQYCKLLPEVLAGWATNGEPTEIEVDYLKNNPKLEIRRGFYRGFKHRSTESFDAFWGRDGDEFMLAILENPTLRSCPGAKAWLEANVKPDQSKDILYKWHAFHDSFLENLERKDRRVLKLRDIVPGIQTAVREILRLQQDSNQRIDGLEKIKPGVEDLTRDLNWLRGAIEKSNSSFAKSLEENSDLLTRTYRLTFTISDTIKVALRLAGILGVLYVVFKVWTAFWK